MSFFGGLTEAAPIEVFYMSNLYKEDQSDKKVNLTVGG